MEFAILMGCIVVHSWSESSADRTLQPGATRDQHGRPISQGVAAPEKVITLSSLIAPRLGRRGENATKDEPFAWASREFLRKKCIGQVPSPRRPLAATLA